jgi:transcriptional antiterminator NusG
MEKVSEVKQGKKTTVNRKFFPGYILVNAVLYDENRQINVRVWNFINDTPGVIGFIGGDRPAPLSPQEVQDIVDQQSGEEESARPKIEFEVGETVKICDGPFENFEGKIESIDPEHGKLKLSVSIFNRITPVEVGYWQVERQES